MVCVNVFHLAIYAVGFLPSAVEQRPPLVFDIAYVNIVPVVFPKRDSGAAKHEEVVPVQNSWNNMTV